MTTSFQRNRPAEILLVDDNEDDVELTRIALQQTRFAINLHTVFDGEQCMDFLHKKPPYAIAPTPDLVLLDLNMPRMDGREVLMLRANEPALRSIPFVVMTTSNTAAEIRHAYQLGCNTYIGKPLDFQHYARILRSLIEYWFAAATLPTDFCATSMISTPGSDHIKDAVSMHDH